MEKNNLIDECKKIVEEDFSTLSTSSLEKIIGTVWDAALDSAQEVCLNVYSADYINKIYQFRISQIPNPCEKD